MSDPHVFTNRTVLGRRRPLELVLSIDSFAGGENTVSEDQATKANEAREITNWDADSLGGMIRSKGINEIANGGVTYSAAPDLLIHHDESGTDETYGVIAGDLIILNGTSLSQEDASAFTSGKLCHAVSAGGALWVTNSTDNLKRKTIGNAIAAATGLPAQAYDRIYHHKNRLLVEGGATTKNRINGSRSGIGNWNSATGFSASNDAFTVDLPNDTRGCVPSFPTGDEVLVFTEFSCFSIYNFPNVAFREIPNGRGCTAPLSIARGDEGVFFVSQYPTLGVFLYDRVNFVELTQYNKDVFVEKIDFSKRVFGIYRDKKYYIFYNESGSGVSYLNKIRIYDTRFGRWMEREINPDLSDNLGYPALLNTQNNELYVASSRADVVYEMETGTEDEGNDTEATYKSKDFSSVDFSLASGGQFPIDDVRMKLVKLTTTLEGTTGNLSVLWSADRGKYSGSKVFDLTSDGDLINSTFTMNTSKVVTTPPDRTLTKTFPNGAVGKRFSFQITNQGTSTRPILKRLKVHAIAMEEN